MPRRANAKTFRHLHAFRIPMMPEDLSESWIEGLWVSSFASVAQPSLVVHRACRVPNKAPCSCRTRCSQREAQLGIDLCFLKFPGLEGAGPSLFCQHVTRHWRRSGVPFLALVSREHMVSRCLKHFLSRGPQVGSAFFRCSE